MVETLLIVLCLRRLLADGASGQQRWVVMMQKVAQCSPVGPRHSEVIDGDVIVRTDELAPAEEEL